MKLHTKIILFSIYHSINRQTVSSPILFLLHSISKLRHSDCGQRNTTSEHSSNCQCYILKRDNNCNWKFKEEKKNDHNPKIERNCTKNWPNIKRSYCDFNALKFKKDCVSAIAFIFYEKARGQSSNLQMPSLQWITHLWA